MAVERNVNAEIRPKVSGRTHLTQAVVAPPVCDNIHHYCERKIHREQASLDLVVLSPSGYRIGRGLLLSWSSYDKHENQVKSGLQQKRVECKVLTNWKCCFMSYMYVAFSFSSQNSKL